jgi:hypothetical protein
MLVLVIQTPDKKTPNLPAVPAFKFFLADIDLNRMRALLHCYPGFWHTFSSYHVFFLSCVGRCSDIFLSRIE